MLLTAVRSASNQGSKATARKARKAGQLSFSCGMTLWLGDRPCPKRGGQGRGSYEDIWSRSARWPPAAAGMRPMGGRDDSSEECSDDSGPMRYPEDEIDSDCL